MQSNGTGISRLGMIVSKRTMPKAVSRNFAKRLVREVFRRDSPAVGGWDVLVQARKQIGAGTSEEGRKALKQLLQAVQA
jgi:ribonuclease P protein component